MLQMDFSGSAGEVSNPFLHQILGTPEIASHVTNSGITGVIFNS